MRLRNIPAILALIWLAAAPVAAKTLQWMDAKFVKITASQGPAVAVISGGVAVAGRVTRNYYWFKAGNITYIGYWEPRLSGRLPDLTLNGPTQIAMDGRNLKVKEDNGKEVKFSSVQKVADPN